MQVREYNNDTVAVYFRFEPLGPAAKIVRSAEISWQAWNPRVFSVTNPVYIDGRIDMYGDEFMREYLGIIHGITRWQEAFAATRAGEGIKFVLDPIA